MTGAPCGHQLIAKALCYFVQIKDGGADIAMTGCAAFGLNRGAVAMVNQVKRMHVSNGELASDRLQDLHGFELYVGVHGLAPKPIGKGEKNGESQGNND